MTTLVPEDKLRDLAEWLKTKGCEPMPSTSNHKAVAKYCLSALLHLQDKELIQQKVPKTSNKKGNGTKEKLKPVASKDQKQTAKDSGLSSSSHSPEEKTQKSKVEPTLKRNAKKRTAAKDEKIAEPGKQDLTKDPEDLANALVNMKIQGDKGCSCKGECKTKICGCRKKGTSCSVNCKCKPECVNNKAKAIPEELPEADEKQSGGIFSSDEEEEEEEEEEDGDDDDDKPLVDLKPSLNETQELGVEEVNWEEHLAKLISCPKCSRKFFPQRIEKHMEVCKNI